jgi:hypothetical protein
MKPKLASVPTSNSPINEVNRPSRTLLYKHLTVVTVLITRHWGMAMNNAVSGQDNGYGTAALSLMEEALALLDQGDVAPDVGAHLDLAICRLRQILGIEVVAESGEAGASHLRLEPSCPLLAQDEGCTFQE